MGMKTANETETRFIILGSRRGLFNGALSPRLSICHDRLEVEAAVSRPTHRVTWISFTRHFTDILLQKALAAPAGLRGSHLITLKPPRAESIQALLGLFHPVFGVVEGFQWLPTDELIEVIIVDDASDRFIGGSVDLKSKTMTLLRGDITALYVPFSLFPKAGDGTAPDFANLKLKEYGRTIALGDYEAASDAILYECDADFRRRLKKQRRQDERTFGSSLMRLRKQRKLKRNDFAPLSSKEIGRIERNEIGRPHARTLKVIADHLGVSPEAIETY
jgi:hypothetical protein